jgi:hypothetical protein
MRIILIVVLCGVAAFTSHATAQHDAPPATSCVTGGGL